MKVAAFNGSPRKDGNTAHMLRLVLADLQKEGIETEFVQVGGELIHGCKACGACRQNKDMRCVISTDKMNDWIQKMNGADGILIGSPTYIAGLTPETKALIDRCCYVSRSNGNFLKRKVGAAVVAARRAGAVNVFDSINHFFTISEMIVPGSSYWNLTLSLMPGDFEKDAEANATMHTLADNMAWLLKRLK
ncbi:MAG: flavodoxin family protein [Methanomassiliicoccaceae archaeon]|jgi:multimeric flavodoxin WrbA|nr:flavodoxin family protein [Methanomassiliicoccaceae archaeon]